LSVLTLELGWITTEVGRQPWIAYRVMKINDAVTPDGGVWIMLIALVMVYGAMTIGVVTVLRSMARRWRAGAPIDLPTPYSPPS
jgi:cytochrome d ubiquinol oxidase subunit I